jgi:hypothetical protein
MEQKMMAKLEVVKKEENDFRKGVWTTGAS